MTASNDDDSAVFDMVLPFRRSERVLIEQLIEQVRIRMVSATPRTLQKIAAYLYVLQRLPIVTPELSLDLVVAERVDGNLAYVSAELNGESFRLSQGGSIYTPGVGSDSFSETLLYLEAGGYREGSSDAFEYWLSEYDRIEGEIEIHGELDTPELSDDELIDGWSHLTAYWKLQEEDDDC